MQDFLELDSELSRLDDELGLSSQPSTSSALPLLPRQSAPGSAFASTPAPDPTLPPPTQSQALLLGLVRSLNPASFPSPTPPATANGGTPAAADPTPAASPAPAPLPPRRPDEPPDELWWDTVGASTALTSTSALLPPPAPTALGAGLPECLWAGVAAPEARKKRKAVARGKEAEQGAEGASLKAKGKAKGKRKAAVGAEVPGLGGKMRQNFETLRKIRRLHGKVASGNRPLDSTVSLARHLLSRRLRSRTLHRIRVPPSSREMTQRPRTRNRRDQHRTSTRASHALRSSRIWRRKRAGTVSGLSRIGYSATPALTVR